MTYLTRKTIEDALNTGGRRVKKREWLGVYENPVDSSLLACTATIHSRATQHHPFGSVIEALLYLLLVFMPVGFGGAQAWKEEWLLIVTAAMTVFFLLGLMVKPQLRWVGAWSTIPFLVLILLGCFQLLPLPSHITKLIASEAVTMTHGRLEHMPDSDMALQAIPLSVYPYGTQHALRMILALGCILVIVINIVCTRAKIEKLLSVIAYTGGVFALLIIGQAIAPADKTDWLLATDRGLAHVGPFMSLSVGAALALIFIKVHDGCSEQQMFLDRIVASLMSAQAPVIRRLIAVVLLCVSAASLSFRPAALFSLMMAGAFTISVLWLRKAITPRTCFIVLISVCAFMSFLCIGCDAVNRYLYGTESHQDVEGRGWGSAWAWSRSSLLGTGMGTSGVGCPVFSGSTMPPLATHGENDYVQLAKETGVIGLGSVLMFAILTWRAYAHAIKATRIPLCWGAYGLGFGILAVMVHGLIHSGQGLPENAVLAVVVCGVLFVMAQNRHARVLDPLAAAAPAVKAVRIGLLVLAVIAWTGLLYQTRRARLADTYWKQAIHIKETLERRQWQGRDQDYDDLLFFAKTALEYQPTHVQYNYGYRVFQWHALSRYTDPDGYVAINENSARLIEDIIDGLNRTRQICPAFDVSHSTLCELEHRIREGCDGNRRIQICGYETYRPISAEFAADAKRRIKQTLEASCLDRNAPAQSFASLAALYQHEDNIKAAIAYYCKALDRNYDHLGWRHQLAGLLEQQGDIQGAIHELRICLRIKKGHQPYRDMIAKLCVQPGALSMP